MADEFIKWVQKRLQLNGFKPGVADGIPGRNTIAALKAFQAFKGLRPSGQTDSATVEALQRNPNTQAVVAAPKPDLYDTYPWMALALTKKGLLEGKDNAELKKFLKSDGKTLGDPSKLPWCGDFIETCIALTLPREVLLGNPYLARNWMKFGKEFEPVFGSVLVFWRTHKTKSTNGHVTFYVGEDNEHYYCLGGNQSNSVSIAKLTKDRLLGARAPLTYVGDLTHKVRMTGAGPVSTNEA